MADRLKTITKLFALQECLLNPNLTKTDAAVLVVLIEYTSGFYGYAFPAVQTIAEVTRCSERAVQYSLRRLEIAGFVGTEMGGGRKKSSRYRVRLDAFQAPPLRPRIQAAVTKRAQKAAPIEDLTKYDATEKGCNFVQKGCNSVRKGCKLLHPNPSEQNPSYMNPSAYAGATEVAPLREEDFSNEEVAKNLRIVGKLVKHWNEHGISRAEQRRLPEISDFLDRVTESFDTEDRLYGWAYNLQQEIAAWTEN